MKVQKNIEVWLVKKRLPRPIDVVQYDTGIQIVFALQDFTIPSGTSVTLYVQKPSGKFVYQETGITTSGNSITIDLVNQAITEYGNDIPYQVRLMNAKDLITTFAGVFRVEKSLADAGAEASQTVIAAFEAKTDEQLAKIEAAAQNQVALIQNQYNLFATKNEAASAIKGNLSGSVVFADDVSPVEHSPNVEIHGKNLVPYGTITFTKNQSYLLDKPIPAGTYTISAYITSSDTDGIYSAVSINNKSEVMKYIALKRGVRVSSTFTVDKPITNIDFCSAYNYAQGEGDSATWADIQLEKGATATEYTPYIDPSTVTVTRCGKNLIPYPFKETTVTKKGVTFTDNKDGTITVNGTAEATVSFIFFEGNMPVDGVYTLSGLSGGNGSTYYVQPLCSDKAHPGLADGSKSYEWGGLVMNRLQLNVVAGTVVSNLRVSVMLEKSNTATDYEPYNGAEYAPAADGTVSGITSLSPNMTILTDTEGMIVECEYIRDTKKYIDRSVSGILTATVE